MAYEHKLPALPFPYDKLKGISKQTNEWHHDKHFKAYVDGRNDVEKKLADMRAKGDFTGIRGVKLLESHNASGMILHTLYYDILGGDGSVDMNSALVKKIIQDFGSFELWKKEFVEVAKAARGWSLLVFDPSDERLHNYMVDFQDLQAVWGVTPIFGIDVWEHAYYHDQGPDRAKYIDAFFNNIDWKKVEQKFKAVK